MEPGITPKGSGYIIEWPSKDVVARVKYPSVTGPAIKAEIGLTHQGFPVHRSFLTLTSPSGMREYERRLNQRRPTSDYQVDWSQIVEDLAGITVDAIRAQLPERVLGDVVDDGTFAWRVDNVLVERANNVLWADGGSGKSYFALFLATLISEGYVDTDHRLVVEPGNVLFCDYETSEKAIAERVRKLHAGLGIARPSKIIYQPMSIPFVQDVDRIMDVIDRRSITVLIIDSMGLAAGKIEDSDQVQAFFRSLSYLNERFSLTTLVITHANRQGTMFGSAYIQASARSLWEAKRTSGSISEGSMDFSLFHRKANDVPIQPAQAWSVVFGADSVVYKRIDVYETEAAGELSYTKLVERILHADGPQDREYLDTKIASFKLGATDEKTVAKIRANISTAVTRHRTAGRLQEREDGMLVWTQQAASEQEGQGEWSI
jgi:hypothetical protein